MSNNYNTKPFDLSDLEIGDKFYYNSGQLHKEDGPAIEKANGDKMWYQYGKLHRLDGPAIEYSNGNKEWWINGQKIQ
jgi:hypothetical protein